jgi:CheY-like chemotaxis protein
VVDDDPITRQLLGEVVHSAGYRPLLANGGMEGLAIASMEHPNVILLDIMMPEMDGFEVMRRLKQSSELSRIPVCILTAKDLDNEERELLKRGAVAFFQKGMNWQEDLLAQIRTITSTSNEATKQVPQEVV